MKIYQPKDHTGDKLISEKDLISRNYATKEELSQDIESTKTELEEKIDLKADQTSLDEHTSNADIHTSLEEKGKWDAKAEPKDITQAVEEAKSELEGKINLKADQSALDEHTQDTDIHTTSEEKQRWDAKAEPGSVTQEIEEAKTELEEKINQKADTTKIEEIEGNVTTNTQNITQLQEEIEGLASQEDLDELSTKVTGLETTVNQKADQTAVDTLSSKVDDLDGEIKSTKSTLEESIQSTKQDLEGQIQTAKEGLSEEINSAKEEISQRVDTLDQNKADKSALDEHAKDTNLHVTQQKQEAWDAKLDQSVFNTEKTKLEESIQAVEDKIPTVDEHYSSESDNPQSGKAVAEALSASKEEIMGEVSSQLENYTNTEELEGKLGEITNSVTKAQSTADKANTDLASHAADTTLHPTVEQQTEWSNKVSSETLESTKQEITEAYKEAINKAVGTVFNWKGTVDTEDDLTEKEAEAKVGDVWNVKDTGANFVWSGPREGKKGGWDKLSENLEGFATKDSLNEHINNNRVHFSGEEKSTWDATLQNHTSTLVSLLSTVTDANNKITQLQQDKESLNQTIDEHTSNTKIHFKDDTEKSTWETNISNNTTGLASLRSDYDKHAANTEIHFETGEKATWKSDIDTAKTDIAGLKDSSQSTGTELSELQSQVEQNESTLNSHIADVTNMHFGEGEKDQLKKDVEANKSAIATKADATTVTELEQKVDEFIGSVGKEWSAETSPESEAPQSGKAVKGAIDEALKGYTSTEDLTSQLATKADKNALEALQGTVEGHTSTITEIQETLEQKADQSAVDDLSNRIETIEGQTIDQTIKGNETSENAASSKAVADYVKETKTDLEEKINLKADLTKVTEIEENVTTNTQNITQLQEKVETLATKETVEQLSEKVTSLETSKVDKTYVDGKFEDYATKTELSTLEETVNKKADTTKVEEVESKVTTNTENITKLQQKVETLATTESLEELTTKVTGLESTKADKTYVDDKLGEYATKEELSTLETTVETKADKTKLEEVEGKVTTNTQSIESLQSTVETLATQENLNTLSTKVDGLETTVNQKADQSSLDEHTKNKEIHTSTEEKANWSDKYTQSEVDQKLEEKVDETQFQLFTERVDELENQYNTLDETVTELQQEVKTKTEELSNNKADKTTVEGIDGRVTELEENSLTEESTFQYTPTASTSGGDQSAACSYFQVNSRHLKPGSVKSITISGTSEAEATAYYLTLFVSSDAEQWINLGSSTNSVAITGEGTYNFASLNLPPDLHVRFVFSTSTEGVTEKGDDSVSVTVSGAERQADDLVSKMHSSNADSNYLAQLSVAYNASETESIKDHIGDTTKHLTQKEKQDLVSFLQGYDGTTNVKDILKKLSESATETNLSDIQKKLEQKAEQSTVTQLQSQVNQKADQSSLDTLSATVETKASTEELNSAKSDLEGKINLKADQSDVDDLSARVDELEGATIDQQISGNEQSANAASSKAVADYVKETKSDIDAKIAQKADTTKVEEVESKVTTNTENITKLQETVGTLATTESLEELTTKVTGLESTKADKTYVDDKFEDYTTKTEFSELESTVEGKAEQTDLDGLQETVTTLQSTVTTHTSDTDIHVKKTDKTKWDAKIDASVLDAAKTELTQLIDSKVQSMFHYKGALTSASELEDKKGTAVIGDVWNVTENGANYVYDGENWDKLSEDLTGFATTNQLTQHTQDTTIHVQEGEKSTWNNKADQDDIDTAVNAAKSDLQESIDKKAEQSALDTHTKDTTIHTTSEEKKKWDAKADPSAITEAVESAKTELETQINDKVSTSDFTEHTEDTDIHVTAQKQTEWDAKADSSAIESAVNAAKTELEKTIEAKADASALTTHESDSEKHVTQQLQDKWNDTYSKSEVDTKLEDYVSSEDLTSQLADKVSQSDLTEQLSGKADTETVTSQLADKANSSDLTSHTGNNDIHVTKEKKAEWDAKADSSAITSAVNTAKTALEASINKKAEKTDLTTHTSNQAIHLTTEQKNKLDKAIVAIGANQFTEIQIYLDPNQAPELSSRTDGVLYLIAEST